MTLINDLHIAPGPGPGIATTEFPRIHRDAIWWANLPHNRRPINIYLDNGRYVLSPGAGPGTLIATIRPDMQYASGEREEWREWQMWLGDRRQ